MLSPDTAGLGVALTKVNDALAIHGGACKVVAVDQGTLVIQLIGGCAGCPSSRSTLYGVVGPIFEAELPWVDTVLLDLGEKHATYEVQGA